MTYYQALFKSPCGLAFKVNVQGQKVVGGHNGKIVVQSPYNPDFFRSICTGYDEDGNFVTEEDRSGHGWQPIQLKRRK